MFVSQKFLHFVFPVKTTLKAKERASVKLEKRIVGVAKNFHIEGLHNKFYTWAVFFLERMYGDITMVPCLSTLIYIVLITTQAIEIAMK